MPPALPVLRVVANRRNAGKTWLASALIAELTRRGFTVGAVKHSHHAVPVDKPGSDTDLFSRAGAASVVFVASDGVLVRAPAVSELAPALDALRGVVDVAVVEGFKAEAVGAELRIDGDTRDAVLTSMDGRTLLHARRNEVQAFVEALIAEFELASGGDAQLQALVRRAAAQHGHHCPGVTLGVRMALAAASALDVSLPAGHRQLEVVVETSRCATDAIASATGCTLGQRTLHVEEHATMAARFLDVATGRTVRVAARDESKSLAALWAPEGVTRRHAQSIAYRVMPDALLLDVTPVPGADPAITRAGGRALAVGGAGS